MTRHEARETVFQLLFEYEFNKEKTCEEIINAAIEARELKVNDYIKTTFSGVIANLEAIDAKIEMYSNNWKLSRFSNASRSIIRLAIYEIMFTETPPKVCVNEAVEIAKKFDDSAAPSFVNGILNKVIHENDNKEDETSNA